MVTTGILNVIWNIVSPILARVPEISLNYDGIANTTVYQFLKAGLYFLPMQTVKTILAITVSLWVLRVIISLLHSLWSSLPIV